MKRVCYAVLELQARMRCCAAWRLWTVQSGAFASLRGLELPRLARAAELRARVWEALAGLYARLDALFPLGLTWMDYSRPRTCT